MIDKSETKYLKYNTITLDKEGIVKDFESGEITITLTDKEYNALLNQPEIKQSREEYEFIKNAIEKQIPKKPKEYKASPQVMYTECPSCSARLPIGTKYCKNCGQAIWWGEENV